MPANDVNVEKKKAGIKWGRFLGLLAINAGIAATGAATLPAKITGDPMAMGFIGIGLSAANLLLKVTKEKLDAENSDQDQKP